ncbi:hypothetical protein SNE40_005872 [Patella caerulea]|uniref:beta-N-acetylhexosaminidase n=1 Tax=Patella caerulea TaxID=87958 RepID=A0AAN8K2E2_PATCE
MDESSHRLVHLDLKGAPPKISYMQKIFPLFKAWGATGLLIEYEDMFPYHGKLGVLASTTAYSPGEIKEILQLAKQNNLFVIPLIQTFGHLEFVLKHREFAGLRELLDYPMSLCPSKYDSLIVVQTMIDQVMAAHPDTKWLHIGCDEVYHMGLCEDCKRIMADEKLVVEQIFFSHVNSVASYVRQKYPGITPIIWDDMLRLSELPLLKESGLGELVEPMVWHYLTDFMLPPGLFDRLSKVFPNMWVASAFKGATGSSMIVTNIIYHIDNQLAWLKAVEYEKPKFKNIRGIAVTGWQRYDHYAILCELLPHSLPSLAICLQIIKKGSFTKDIHSEISNQLKFTSLLPLVPYNITEEISCEFPGSDVYIGSVKLVRLSAEADALLNSTGVFTWMNDYCIEKNFTNPNHLQPMVNEAIRLLGHIQQVKINLNQALTEIFYPNTVDEWLGVHVLPRFQKLTKIMESGQQQLENFRTKNS